MIDITAWMEDFLQALNETFANRVWFVGLQGSYGRGEAGKPVRHYEHSDAGGYEERQRCQSGAGCTAQGSHPGTAGLISK